MNHRDNSLIIQTPLGIPVDLSIGIAHWGDEKPYNSTPGPDNYPVLVNPLIWFQYGEDDT